MIALPAWLLVLLCAALLASVLLQRYSYRLGRIDERRTLVNALRGTNCPILTTIDGQDVMIMRQPTPDERREFKRRWSP